VPTFGLLPDYEVIKLLGTGGEGETWLTTDTATRKTVAIKLVQRPLPKTIVPIVTRETRILAELGDGHLNIVHAHEVILTHSHLGLVMEYVPGGNMVDYVMKRRAGRPSGSALCVSEEEGRYFFKQLILAVEFCHGLKVAHRDLKLDNTLLDGGDPPRLKLCDFGFAKTWGGAQSTMETMRIGTPEYMGPELIAGRTGYDGKKVDVWASGVLLFVMLLGQFPFEFDDPNYANTAGLYGMWAEQMKATWRDAPQNAPAVAQLSDELKDLLDRMFEVKQDSRISIEGIKAHPWFTKPLPSKYQKALDVLGREQAKQDATFSAAKCRSAERDRALAQMIERASLPGAPSDAPIRVKLSAAAQLAQAPGAAFGALAEEEE